MDKRCQREDEVTDTVRGVPVQNVYLHECKTVTTPETKDKWGGGDSSCGLSKDPLPTERLTIAPDSPKIDIVHM